MKAPVNKETVRTWLFIGIGLAFFAVLGVRLFVLQILQGADFRVKSDSNRIRLIEIAPPRGVMRDRKGRLLLTNRSSYTCYGVPSELWGDKEGMQLLARALQIPPEHLENQMIKPFRRTFLPMRLKRDLSFQELSAFEELRDRIPGAFLEIEQKRYHFNQLAAHALGYVAEVAPEEIDKFPGVKSGDLVGKRGLERLYDEQLRGTKGYRFSIVNAYGQEIAEEQSLERVEPKPGKELWLTLDLDLQAMAESLLVDKIGAIVAMDVHTGGVLCIASSPTYDPDIFAGRLDADQWNMLLTDKDKPMLNRAVQTMYPPGSTVKMSMLLEALQSGTISPSFSISCPGSYTVGNRTFKCWKKGGHGHVDVLRSIEQSCDVFYYRVGMLLGVDGVHDAFDRVHFGRQTGIDQTSEAAGLIPSVAYYDKRYGESGWTKGFIPSISIGQGEVLVTPIQLCAYACALADGKYWRQPYLVDGVYDPDTQTLERRQPPEPDPIDATPENIAVVREGMRLVVWGAGTAARQQDPQVKIAGKTGTAQNPHGDDHAWFVGFAPVEDPIIATCVLIEFGMHGSSAAAPLSKEIMKHYVLAERPDSTSVSRKDNTQEAKTPVAQKAGLDE
jgi:penicillin-binding protein 2